MTLIKKPRLKRFVLIMLVVTAGIVSAQSPATPGTCLSTDEITLLDMVNQYRADNGKSAVAYSKVLNTVGQWHAEDAFLNSATIFVPPVVCHVLHLGPFTSSENVG